MARPNKEGLDYFPHDTDAVNDEKIEALKILFGNDGYAFYFIHLERIYRTPNFELNISDAETRQILAKKVGITIELYDQILSSAITRGCFDKKLYEKRGILTSNGIKKRALVVVNKRLKMKDYYNNKKVSDAETEQKPGKNPEESSQSKVKKRKVKESKEKNIKKEMPADFCVSERVTDWAKGKGFEQLEEHLESFKRKCSANGYKYLDWDSAFMEAIREDWAKLRSGNGNAPQPPRKEPVNMLDVMRAERERIESNG